MRQSREALARYRIANPDSVLPGAPQGVMFSPWHAIGPFAPPAGKDGFEFAYPPEQEIDFSKQYDGHGWKREHRPDDYRHHDIDLPNYSSLYLYRTITAQVPAKVTVYIGCDDRAKVWLNGEQLLTIMHPSSGTGVELPLTQGENRLLVKIYNVTGDKAYSFSLTPNTKDARGEDTSPEAILWALVAQGLPPSGGPTPNPLGTLRRHLGRHQGRGVVRRRLPHFGPAGMRRRRASRRRSMRRPGSWPARSLTRSDLDNLRELYYRSRTIEETATRIGGLDFAPLRRAITDLTASFGERYPQGQQYLARLESLEKLREAGLQDGAAGVDKLNPRRR